MSISKGKETELRQRGTGMSEAFANVVMVFAPTRREANGMRDRTLKTLTSDEYTVM